MAFKGGQLKPVRGHCAVGTARRERIRRSVRPRYASVGTGGQARLWAEPWLRYLRYPGGNCNLCLLLSSFAFPPPQCSSIPLPPPSSTALTPLIFKAASAFSPVSNNRLFYFTQTRSLLIGIFACKEFPSGFRGAGALPKPRFLRKARRSITALAGGSVQVGSTPLPLSRRTGLSETGRGFQAGFNAASAAPRARPHGISRAGGSRRLGTVLGRNLAPGAAVSQPAGKALEEGTGPVAGEGGGGESLVQLALTWRGRAGPLP